MDDVRTTASFRLKRAYATTAHGVGRALMAVHLLPKQAPSPDRRIRHWVFSLSKVHDSIALAELDLPWWTYRAIDIVDAWLLARPHPIRVFEYGSGASTVWLARRVDEVYTVEHHLGFADHMAPVLSALPGVTVIRQPGLTSASPRIGSQKSGHDGLDFYDYVHAIDGVDSTFDLVVVDGRAREACLTAAMGKLAQDGLIVFDNTKRRRYREAIGRSGMSERRLPGLTPTLPYPDQTSVLSAH